MSCVRVTDTCHSQCHFYIQFIFYLRYFYAIQSQFFLNEVILLLPKIEVKFNFFINVIMIFLLKFNFY